MKKMIVAMMLMFGMGAAQANPAILLETLFHGTVIGMPYYSAKNETPDPRLFETVEVKHNDDSNYTFTITQYAYDANPGKYVKQ